MYNKYYIFIAILVFLVIGMLVVRFVNKSSNNEDNAIENVNPNEIVITNIDKLKTYFKDEEEANRFHEYVKNEIKNSGTLSLKWTVENDEFSYSLGVLEFKLTTKSGEFFTVRVNKENTIMTYSGR